MKYLFTAALLLATALTGCVSDHQNIIKPGPAQPAPPPPPPVTVNQVNSENAHAVSQALWDEMDRESQNEQMKEPTPKTSPTKK